MTKEVCGLVTGVTLLYSGISAGFGAASGAIGQSVLTRAGWTSANLTCSQMVKATSLGSFLISIPMGVISGCMLAIASEVGSVSVKASSNSLIWAGVSGTLSSLLGGAILGYLSEGAKIGFAAATGATGSAILGVGLSTVACVILCCAGGTFLCSQSLSGDLNLLKIPKKNLDNQGNITSLEGITVVDPKLVIPGPVPSITELSEIVSQKMDTPIHNPEGFVAPANSSHTKYKI
ncbi:MAG: hypothetical protein JWM09_912 [Francisellaceae bacterium]|nr:hypothetical protein [Francisellaceae bacterium]